MTHLNQRINLTAKLVSFVYCVGLNKYGNAQPQEGKHKISYRVSL